jgi:hypothetical protein
MFVTATEDIEVLKEIIVHILNFRKSQVLAVGSWDLERSMMGFP